MLLSLLLMFSAAAMAFLLLLLSLLLLASIYLLAFSALTVITAVADDQCHAFAGFLSFLRSPLLFSSLLLLLSVVPTVAD